MSEKEHKYQPIFDQQSFDEYFARKERTANVPLADHVQIDPIHSHVDAVLQARIAAIEANEQTELEEA